MGGSLCSPDRGLTGPDVAVGSSVPSVDLDLTGLGQHVNDVGFEVGVVHARLPELARIPVVLPVVVPVASAVSPEPIHVHLWAGGTGVTGSRGPWWEWGAGGTPKPGLRTLTQRGPLPLLSHSFFAFLTSNGSYLSFFTAGITGANHDPAINLTF